MDLDRTPAQIANAAAEEIRALNHRTLDPRAFREPADLLAAVEALTLLVQLMPHALTHTATALRVQEERGAIRLNSGNASQQDLVSAFVGVLTGLQEGRGFLERTHEQLQDATGHLSRIGWCMAEAHDKEAETSG